MEKNKIFYDEYKNYNEYKSSNIKMNESLFKLDLICLQVQKNLFKKYFKRRRQLERYK